MNPAPIIRRLGRPITAEDMPVGRTYASTLLVRAHRRGQVVRVGWGVYDLPHRQERVGFPPRVCIVHRVAGVGAWADRATASEIAAWLGASVRGVRWAIGSDRSRGVR